MKVIVHLDAREEQARGFVRKITICLLVIGFIAIVGASVSPLLANSTSSVSGSVSSRGNLPPAVAGNFPGGAANPRFVAGQMQVDPYTVALYHFDNPSDTVAIDETGNYTGTLYSNARIVNPGLYDGDLQLDPSSYVNIPNLGAMSTGTIEAFVDFSQAYCSNGGTFPIFSAYDSLNNPLLKVGQYWDGYYNTLQFSGWTSRGWFATNSNINACRYLTGTSWVLWPYEAWRFHHVAITWGARGVEIWVDGVQHAAGINADWPGAGGQITCNPQMQMFALPYTPLTPTPWGPTPGPWTKYPLCPGLLSPLPPASGTYTGGLGPLDRLQIGGCYPGLGCFNGRIDELRISNIQRTYDYRTTDPTSTPAPTQTPVPLNGGYQVDSNTLRLYYLESKNALNTVYDEVTHENYRAGANTNIVPGRHTNGLQYSINSGPTIMENEGAPGYEKIGWPSNGTLEAWINLSSATPPFDIFGARMYSTTNSESLIFGADTSSNRTLKFGMLDGSGVMNWVDSGVDVSRLVGAWHHVAATWGSSGMKIWIDGSLCNTGSYTGRLQDPVYEYFAGCGPWGKCINGVMDDIRVSDVARTFTLAKLGSLLRSNSPRVPLSDTLTFLPYVSFAPTPTPNPYITCGSY